MRASLVMVVTVLVSQAAHGGAGSPADGSWECPLEQAVDLGMELKAEQAQTGFLVSSLQRADKNADGVITKVEAAEVRGVIADFDEMDVNADGQVTVQEVADWLRSRLTLQARVIMRMGDRDKDGVITREESIRYPLLKENFDALARGQDSMTEDEIFLALLDVARQADRAAVKTEENQGQSVRVVDK